MAATPARVPMPHRSPSSWLAVDEGVRDGSARGKGISGESPHWWRLLRYDDCTVIAASQRRQIFQPGQLGLLFALLLLAHIGVMALSGNGVTVTPASQEMADSPVSGPAERLAEPPMACPGSFGDCMLAWRLPGSNGLMQGILGPSSFGGLTDLRDEARTADLASTTHGPPRWASLQVLLQVFRI